MPGLPCLITHALYKPFASEFRILEFNINLDDRSCWQFRYLPTNAYVDVGRRESIRARASFHVRAPRFRTYVFAVGAQAGVARHSWRRYARHLSRKCKVDASRINL